MTPDNRNPTRIRAAIIGCGLIAGGYDNDPVEGAVRTHARAYQANENTDLVAIVDPDAETMAAFAKRWSVADCYDDLQTMLAQAGPDVVSICSPDDLHAQALEACLHSPTVRGVWCEKPLTTDVTQAKALIEAYTALGKSLVVNYPRPYAEKFVALKKQLLSGDFGPVQKVVAYYSKGIMHNGSHALDLLMDWFGAPVSSRVFRGIVDFTDADPTVDALVLLQDVPVYLMGLDERCYSQFEIDIFCAAARVSITHHGRYIQVRRLLPDSGLGGHSYLDDVAGIEEIDASNAMVGVLQTLIASLGKANPTRRGDHIMCVMELCDKLAGSGRSLLQEQNK